MFVKCDCRCDSFLATSEPQVGNVNWSAVVDLLRSYADIRFDEGLTADEVTAIEVEMGFCFPPDLRSLLRTALPAGDGFPDWRADDKANIVDRLGWPLRGICFDIEDNNFWLDEWGPRPGELEQAFAIARSVVLAAPTLIPIYGHRYIPDKPSQAGNPVFSVYQTDIIYYGFDLLDYFSREFGILNPTSRPHGPRSIEFWDFFVN